MPARIKWQKNSLPERFERFARNVFNIQGADNGIEALINWYRKIGTPLPLAEGNIPEKDITMLVEKLSLIAAMWGAESL